MNLQMEKTSFRHKYFGDKAFYKMVLAVAVPIMIQNGITNFVSMLDNIMVGRVGTEQMSGVAIDNQLIFIYFLCIFGAVSGAGIFTAQYFGTRDDKGIQHTFRYKLYISIILTILCILVLMCFEETLIGIYLNGSSDGGDLAATLQYAKDYIHVMYFGLPGFAIVQVYGSTLRECSETRVPMTASIVAVLVNLTFNYLLIWGKFGFPKLGVVGAAIATVMARYVEAAYVIIWTHRHSHIHTFIKGVYRDLRIPLAKVKMMTAKTIPLMFNETLWAAGMAVFAQSLSIRGLNVVAATNISNTIGNVFNVVYIALGDAVAIVIGQLLGAGKMKEAKQKDTWMLVFSVVCATVIGVLMLVVAPLFPQIYNTNAQAKELAAAFIRIYAITMPEQAFIHSGYYTIRSGGKTWITFLFDSAFVWVVTVPLSFVLSRFTGMSAVMIMTMIYVADLLKALIGYVMVKKNIWMVNLVGRG